MSRKRKAPESEHGSEPLSAFAAARLQFPNAKGSQNVSNPEPRRNSDLQNEAQIRHDQNKVADYDSNDDIGTKPESVPVSEASEIDFSVFESQLSSWALNKSSLNSISKDRECIDLLSGDTLAVVGQYFLTVMTGLIFINGAYLSNDGDQRKLVVAPSTHPLPVIRCVSSGGAQIVLESVSSKEDMECLRRVCPDFGGVWRCRCAICTNGMNQNDTNTFTKILRTGDHDPARLFRASKISVQWSQLIAKLAEGKEPFSRIYQVCGGVGSDSETELFCQVLINTLLTSPKSSCRDYGVFVLDLDPDKPLLSIPGQISLQILGAPMLGPSFARTSPQTVKAHYVGRHGYRENIEQYLACVQDLLLVLTTKPELPSPKKAIGASSSSMPVVVHCPNWSLGTANNLMSRLTSYVLPNDIVLLSDPPSTLSRTIQPIGPRVHQLQPEAAEVHPHVRTSAQLRSMSLLSYFHSTPSGWNSTPMTGWKPYQVSYDAECAHFAAVMLPPDPPPMYPRMVSSLFNGMLVALIRVDEDVLAKRKVLRGEGDGIPYLAPGANACAEPFDPAKARCEGVALIRGIDEAAKTLLLLTPVQKEKIEEFSGRNMVLQFMRNETPGWSYLEEPYFKEWLRLPENQNPETQALRRYISDADHYPWVEEERMS